MDATPSVRVLVVDDQAPFRMAARLVIGRTPGFEVAGEATSGEESVALAAEVRPDLILMDINMGEMSGIEAPGAIVAAQPDVVVFLCSTYASSDLPHGAMDTGAAAYLHKEELSAAVLSEMWAQRAPTR
jgi:DNA-binding NarL/FixJ family response regulator